MKTIASLKAEICEDCKWINKKKRRCKGKTCMLIERIDNYNQSLISRIAASVVGCRNVVGHYDFPTMTGNPREKVCKDVPPEQKCPKCQGKIEIRKWLE